MPRHAAKDCGGASPLRAETAARLAAGVAFKEESWLTNQLPGFTSLCAVLHLALVARPGILVYASLGMLVSSVGVMARPRRSPFRIPAALHSTGRGNLESHIVTGRIKLVTQTEHSQLTKRLGNWRLLSGQWGV